MKLPNLISWTAIILFSIIWAGGCSRTLQKKMGDLGIIADDYRFGDLYRMSHLKRFKDPKPHCQILKPAKQKQTVIVIGDSFLEEEPKVNFNTDSLFFQHWNSSKNFYKTTVKKEVLVIECIERHVRTRLASEIIPKRNQLVDLLKCKPDWLFPFYNRTEIMLEQILFSGEIFLRIRELKASMNEAIFERIENEVEISKDKKNILTKEETNASLETSSFCEISETEIQKISANLEKEATKFKNLGFEKVFVAIIPNKTSIVTPRNKQYNRLVERIESYKPKAFKYISVISEFKQNSSNTYRLGDTHWNCEGKEIWFTKANNLIRN